MSGNIGVEVFLDCNQTTTLTLNKNINDIGEGVFGGMYNLSSIYFIGTQEDLDKLNIDITNNDYFFKCAKTFIN